MTQAANMRAVDDLLDRVSAQEFSHTITVTPKPSPGSADTQTGARTPGTPVDVAASPPDIRSEPGEGSAVVEVVYEVSAADWTAAGLPDPRTGDIAGYSVRGADGTDEADTVAREIVRREPAAGGGLARIYCRGRQ